MDKNYISNFYRIRSCIQLYYFLTVLAVGAFFFAPMTTLAQLSGANQNSRDVIAVTGVVKDKGGEPLPGVTIKIKGTTVGATTNANGKYTIKVPDENTTLTFSFIGFKTKEVKVGKQTTLNIVLEEDATMLQEVRVDVGYGKTVSRDRLAASVSSISAKDIADFPVSTAAEALAGKLAGVSVNTTEGAPGADIEIKVRGGTSLSQDNNPLYIVDGVPLERALSIISPNEIQSIDVLKDLASTSIYGARGANGVVIITTKSGKRGRTTVSFDAYAGVRSITNKIDVMKPYDFANFQYELNRLHFNGFLSTDTSSLNGFDRNYGLFTDLEIYKSMPFVDWQDKVFGRDAFSNTQIVTVNGGSENTTYNFSANNLNEDGIMVNSGLKRTFATFRFDHNISKKLKLGLNVRYSRQKITGAGTSSTGSQSNNRLRNSVRFQPYQGLINVEDADPDAAYDNTINLSNPLSSALNETKYAFRNDLITSGTINYNITPQLSVRSLIAYNNSQTDNKTFTGLTSFAVRGTNSASTYSSMPFINFSDNGAVNVTNSNTISFNPKSWGKHDVDFLLGQETLVGDFESSNMTIKYFPASVTPDQAFSNIQMASPPTGAVQDAPTNSVSGERLLSFFGRTMYSYASKYNLTLSIRRDGSSKFAPQNRWGTFPSAQFAWRLSEEKFFKNLNANWIQNIKFRASYGTAGNNRISNDRLYETTFTTSAREAGYAVSDAAQTPGFYGAVLANPNLKWETTVSRNVGLDMDFFRGRLNISLDAYLNRTSDLLLLANIPPQTGFLTQQQNIGKTENKGIEVQLNGLIAKSRNFTYNSSFNISFNRNTIKALQGDGTAYTVNSGWAGGSGSDFWVEVGKPVGQYYGYIVDGFYTVDDFDRTKSDPVKGTWVLKPGKVNNAAVVGQALQPGLIKFKKLTSTGDSLVTDKDRTVLGTVQPKFFGGFNNQFSYKNFDMSVFINFSYGNKTYNANSVEFGSVRSATGNNLLEKFKDRYRRFDENGTFVTDFDQLNAMNVNAKIYSPTRGTYNTTSDNIEDGSFLRITNLTIGYTLPQRLIMRAKPLSKLRVYATVNNLYTFTNYTGFDPEASTRRSNPLTPGVDYSAYPRSRYMLAGINVTF